MPIHSRDSVGARRRRAADRRRSFGLAVVLLAVLAALGLGSAKLLGAGSVDSAERSVSSPGRLELRALGRVVAALDAPDLHADEGAGLRRWRRGVLRRLPAELRTREGGVTVTHRVDRRAAVRRGLAAGRGGGVVDVPVRAIQSRIRAPAIAQELRNNCETAALEILLATVDVRAEQLQLQKDLVRSGPLDPRETPEGRVWGDPERGYVGRPEGGGVAGGFGVYEEPIEALADSRGHRLEDLSGSRVQDVYDRLLDGRAVMTWIGLSDGPYGEWNSPQGGAVRVNFGEHAVVLVGVTRTGQLRVVNPLEGTREVWSRRDFELMWDRLGRRALAT